MATAEGAAWDDKLADGTALRIRTIEASDLARQQAFFDELSPDSRRLSFLMGITNLSPEWLARLCDPEDERDVALVATVQEDGQERQIGLGRYAWASEERGAELAITVADRWQRRGVGTLLLERLIGLARAHGIARLYSIDRSDNTAMRKLASRFGATITRDPDDARQVIAMLDLAGGSHRNPGRQVREVLDDISRLEQELEQLLQKQQAHIRYRIEGTKVKFEQSVREGHARLKTGLLRWLGQSRPRNLLSAPFIYAMIVPFAVLDLALLVYQAVCFRLYGIDRVPRARYIVVDRRHLSYLNGMEKLNCAYCGYANGLLAYAREIAARTEQYWCPIKHARKVLDPHRRYARFADYGVADGYHAHLDKMRGRLAAGAKRKVGNNNT